MRSWQRPKAVAEASRYPWDACFGSQVRQRITYQAAVFATFNLFWTAVPLVLAQSFGLGQRGIALFALAGAGGALAAPIAGRLADRGHTKAATGAVLLLLSGSFLVAGWAAAAGAMALLVLCAVLLDAAVQGNQALSQRVIYGLGVESRGRLNAMYMTIVFLAGATGSMLAGLTYFHGGWWLTALTGGGLGLAVLLFFLGEMR